MNYNYDYGNYMMGYPNTYSYGNNMNYKGSNAKTTFMNNKKKDNDIKLNFIPNMDNANNNLDLVDPYVGLIRGNLFDNLYDPYKNYKARDIDVNNERDSLLGQIQMYRFAIIELNLYLDVYPNDIRALQLLKEYVKEEKELCKQYEMRYRALTVDGVSGNEFNWIESPWPWEVSK